MINDLLIGLLNALKFSFIGDIIGDFASIIKIVGLNDKHLARKIDDQMNLLIDEDQDFLTDELNQEKDEGENTVGVHKLN